MGMSLYRSRQSSEKSGTMRSVRRQHGIGDAPRRAQRLADGWHSETQLVSQKKRRVVSLEASPERPLSSRERPSRALRSKLILPEHDEKAVAPAFTLRARCPPARRRKPKSVVCATTQRRPAAHACCLWSRLWSRGHRHAQTRMLVRHVQAPSRALSSREERDERDTAIRWAIQTGRGRLGEG